MERDQFTFYRSFWEALKALPKKDQLPFVMAVCSYALDGESKPLTGAPYAAFLLVKPILDKASKKSANGKQGGSKPKANGKQGGSKPEQTGSHIEGEREIEEEREREKEKDIYPPTPLQGGKKQNDQIPTFEEVLEEAKIRGVPDLAQPFFDYYAAAGWRDSDGKPVYSWRQKLVSWKVREDDRLRKQIAAERRNRDGGHSMDKPKGSGKKSFAEMAREMEEKKYDT